jgi:hypothetical protein
MAQLTFEQMLAAIENQIRIGKTYLRIGKGLQQTEWAILGAAPTFFGMTASGSLELAQMAMARLYDVSGRLTMKQLVNAAAEQALKFGKFQASTDVARHALLDCASTIISLQPIIDSIRKRRDKWLAHLDLIVVTNPDALKESTKLTIGDLERAMAETEKVFSKIERLYDGTVGPIRFVGEDDYKTVLEFVGRVQAAEMAELATAFEKQFGHPPPDLTRKD